MTVIPGIFGSKLPGSSQGVAQAQQGDGDGDGVAIADAVRWTPVE